MTLDSEQNNALTMQSTQRNWQARMIAPLADAGQGSRASFVTTTFRAKGSARLYISAQGLYRAYLNGQRIGDDELTPGWTSYDDRIAYQSYDLTDLLVDGDNRIEIWLGDGWFRSQMLWDEEAIFNCWGDRIATIAEVEVDGSVVTLTDESWNSGLLPITQSGIYFEEDFDARYTDLSANQKVEVLPFDTTRLVPHETAPVKTMTPLVPIKTWSADGQLYDFGQNIAGWVSFRTRGSAGAVVRVEHSEVLDGEGRFDNRNYRSARAETHYTLGGKGEQSYTPHFTFMGFRYARITIEGDAQVSDVVAVPVTSVPERASQIRQAFAHEYIAPSGRLTHNDMTSYALAILCDLIPIDKLAAAKACFAKVRPPARKVSRGRRRFSLRKSSLRIMVEAGICSQGYWEMCSFSKKQLDPFER